MTLLGDVSLSQLESRLAVWQAMIESQKEMGIQVSKEFQTALGEAQEATDLYEASIKRRIPPRVFMTLRPKTDAGAK